MEDAIYIIKRLDDFCPVCKRNYALQMFNGYGQDLNFFKSLNRNQMKYIESQRNVILKCRYCNSEIPIDRTDTNRYVPLVENATKDNSYEKFMNDINSRKEKLLNKHKVRRR